MSRVRAARVGRVAAGWLTVAVGVVVVTVVTGSGGSSEALDADDVQRGGQLYAMYCVGCHGPSGEGGQGPGILAGPPVDDIDVAFADLVIRTGRMPIVAQEAGILSDPNLDETDRAQLVAWMAESFDLEGEVPDVPDGDPSRGRILFNEHCAACHSTTGWGGVAGGSIIALPIRDLDRVALFSASRVGPFEMPSFPETVLSDEDLADIAASIERMDQERPSQLAFTDLTHVSATIYSIVAVAVIVGLVAFVARLPEIRVAKDEEFQFEDAEDPENPEETP